MIGQITIIRRRGAGGEPDPDTGRASAITWTETDITAAVQPLNGRERSLSLEGEEIEVTAKLYTADDLRAADDLAGTVADQVVIDDEVLEVVRVDPWPRGLIPHRKAYVRRVKVVED